MWFKKWWQVDVAGEQLLFELCAEWIIFYLDEYVCIGVHIHVCIYIYMYSQSYTMYTRNAFV